MLLHDASRRRARRIEADMAEAVAMGYSGCRAQDGPKALQRFIDERRK